MGVGVAETNDWRSRYLQLWVGQLHKNPNLNLMIRKKTGELASGAAGKLGSWGGAWLFLKHTQAAAGR